MSTNIAIVNNKVNKSQENNSNRVTESVVSSIYDFYIDDTKEMLFVHPMANQGGIDRHLPMIEFQLDEVMGFAMEIGYIENYDMEAHTVDLIVGGEVYDTSFEEFFATFFQFDEVLKFVQDDIKLTEEMATSYPLYTFEVLSGNRNGIVVRSQKRYALWSNILRAELQNLSFVQSTKSSSPTGMIIYTDRGVSGRILKAVKGIFGV